MQNQSHTHRLSADHIGRRPRTSVASLPAVVKLANALAEGNAIILSATGATPWRVALDRIEEHASVSDDDHGTWLRLESHAGSMMFHLAFDRPMISALCEAALGGIGAESPYEFPDRPLSAIEGALLNTVIAKLSAQLAIILSEHLETPVSLFDGALANDDADVTQEFIAFRFLVNVFSYSGEMKLTALSGEIAAQFTAAASTDGSSAGLEEARAEFQQRISRTNVEFIVSLGREMLFVEEIAALAPGRLIRLSATTATPVLIKSGDSPVFKASLARSADHLAVRIIAPLD